MATISTATLRIALINYKTEVMEYGTLYPDVYTDTDDIINEIDNALLSIEGNITTATVLPDTCKC